MSCTESMVPFNSCQSKQVDSRGTGQTTGRMWPPNSAPVPAGLHNVSWSLRALPTEAPPSPDTHFIQVLSETQEWVLMR